MKFKSFEANMGFINTMTIIFTVEFVTIKRI